MVIQLILFWTDTRASLPDHFENVLFATLTGKILYGAWQRDHRRFYTPGAFYDLADVERWARVPKTVQEADDTSVTY